MNSLRKYKAMSPAQLLEEPEMPHLRPIRPCRWDEYRDIWGGDMCVSAS